MADKINWTDQQQRAIAEQGRDVFVTASAGTGKTAVLSGRCVSIAARPDVCPDIWSVLVLTFTDMAAEEMRSRIAEQLRVAMAASRVPAERQHLRRQLLLLGGADISTIHSFCRRLIAESFYEVGLDPGVGVLDADESRLLKAEALEKTVDWAWRQGDLEQGLTELLGGRDLRVNEGFTSKVIEVSNYLDGVVHRQGWFGRARVLAEELNPFDGDIGKEQKRIIARKIEASVDRIRCAQQLYRQSGTGNWAQNWDREFAQPLSECLEVLKKGDWEHFTDLLSKVKPPRNNKPDAMDGVGVEIIRASAETAKKELKEYWQLAVLNLEYLDKLARAVGLQTRVMIKLVEQFDRFYAQAKERIGCLDFADLQQYAAKLLCAGFDEQGGTVASPTAKALRGRYRYIFVDEYQDINAVQQLILDMLSSGGNVFGVGDVKQSIYSWRGARPGIFLERIDGAVAKPAKSDDGLRVDLNVNFRSDERILDFVNVVFSKVMTEGLCGIEYDESARLRAGEAEGRTTSDGDKVVELHILDEQVRETEAEEQEQDDADGDVSQGSYSGRQRQAALIAQRIREIVSGKEFQILDKQTGRRRDVEYSDIVILMRSVAKKVDFVEVLRLAGLAVNCEATAGYFEATEISDMLCLLKVLDNPRRDIELAAVLRSPLFGVSDTQLAKIRLWRRAADELKSFFECVVDYSEGQEDSELAGKLREVLERLEGWRTEARRGKLADLIWRVYRQTGYLSFVCALPSGAGRRANLLKLYERAIQFEGFASSGGVPSLTRFIDFVEKLVELRRDWSAAEPESAGGNAVRVMSVHKSKGLEFGVVFLPDLNSRFNLAVARGDCLVDERFGLGLKVIDDQTDGRFDSLAQQVISERRRDESLAEEMRILYVAMTRARDRLILIGAEKGKRCRQVLCEGLLAGKKVAEWQLRSCGSHLDWLLYGLSDSSELHKLFETALQGSAESDKLFRAILYGRRRLDGLNNFIEQLRMTRATRAVKGRPESANKPRMLKLLEDLKARMSRRYDFADATVLPAKRSVTQWTHTGDEYVRRDYSAALQRRPKVVTARRAARGVDARLVGTACHLVIAELDLAGAVGEKAVRELLTNLVGNRTLTPAVAERVDVAAIAAFFESELGKVVLDKDNTVYREWPFTFTVPAAQWRQREQEQKSTSAKTGDDETIIVQGIIDMLIKTEKGLLIVDFKTDAVGAGEVEVRAEVYRGQLGLYVRAAEAILKKKVVGAWLYFLHCGRLFQVV